MMPDFGFAMMPYLLKRVCPHIDNDTLFASFEVVKECVAGFSHLAEKTGSSLRLGLEAERKNGSRYKVPVLKSIVIYTPKKRTIAIPASLSPGVLRLNGKPVFLAHEGGAEALVEALRREVEIALAAESEAA